MDDELKRKGFSQVRNNMVASTMFFTRRNFPQEKNKVPGRAKSTFLANMETK
jgi:hypothetical protein